VAEVIAVEIAGKRLGISRSLVRTIVAAGSEDAVFITPVPTAPPLVAGVTQIRGHIVPVVDLADVPRPVQPEDPLLVVEYGPARVALRVDRVLGDEAGDVERMDAGALFDRIRDSIGEP
jgi:chemotaxis signal transduction protein